MPISTYTTTIEATKTVGEIQTLLVRGGARRIAFDYDDKGAPVAIAFEVQTKEMGLQQFRYEPNISGVFTSMMNDKKVPRSKVTRDQATRVAWRIEKLWLEAMFAKIEAAREPLEKIMFAYMLTPTGPMYERAVSSYKALPEASQNGS